MYIEQKELFRWRRARKNKQEIAICTKLLVIGQIVLSSISFAVAGPTGEVITNGSGTITRPDAVTTQINQASQRLDINWQTFSTAKTESVNFLQPTSMAVAINRVIGGVPSYLEGALNANGRVFILNESGITFAGTSQVNVGALIATTAKDVTVSDDDKHYKFSGKSTRAVINDGRIQVSPGGFAILAAPYVQNTGFIQANLGRIELASTRDFTVDLRGDGLIDFTVTKENVDAIAEEIEKLGVDNSGTLQAQSGTIGISANLASSIVHSVVNLGGVVDADAFGAGHNGGTVMVTSVGDLNITGNVHADGGANGNGGTIYTWADGVNRVTADAVMTARGGTDGGDGGLIEVSGAKVIYRGTADASAPKGAAGTLLIDPWDITIANGAGTDDTATVYEQNIEATSVGGTNVSLVADHSITMNSLVTDHVLQGGAGDISMTVTQGGTISFVDKSDTIATTSGKITMSAADGAEGAGKIDIGHLQTTGYYADITVDAGSGGIHTGNLSTGGEGLGVAHPGDIELTTSNGGHIQTGNISIIAEGIDSASAYLNADASGNLETGSILVKATDDTSSAYATADLTAGGDITTDDITVAADGAEGDATASLHAHADGNLDAGTIMVKALADNTNGGAAANADADLSAGGNITLAGGVTVEAKAHVVGFDSASAYANLNANAGNDLSITGGLNVSAEATQTGTYGYDTTSATANADLDAGNSITINGDIAVQAVSLNDVPNATSAQASAYLKAHAWNGDLSITGNTLVQADARVPEGKGSSDYGAYADAGAVLSAGRDVAIKGDITVQGTALYNAPSGSEASADANLEITAGNDLSVTGSVLVEADATLQAGWDDADADASADLQAGRDLTLGKGITVQATALNLSTAGDDAEADASLDAHAGRDLTVNGNVLVKADATLQAGTDDADADASAHLGANHDLTLNNGITVQATALNVSEGNEDSMADEADADDASLYAHAGHDLTVNGNVLVKSDATLQAGTGDADADASAQLEADQDLTLNNGITVQATALNLSTEGKDAEADAWLGASAGHDLTVNGNVLVKADATLQAGTGEADADANAGLGLAHDLALNNGITVQATALNLSTEGKDAEADAGLNISANHDITLNGDVRVQATAHNNGYAYSYYSGSAYGRADASASLNVNAEHDVTVSGNTLVTAEAVQSGEPGEEVDYYYSDADANANASLYARNDLTIRGDTTVRATSEGGDGGEGEGCATCASLSATAGNDVNISGNTLVEANQTRTGYYDYYSYGGGANASLYANAVNDLSITGSTLVEANQTGGGGYYYDGGGYNNGANAWVNLYADNDLTIHGDTTARATSEGGDEGGGYANASLYASAGNNVSITGNTLAEANQTGGGGYYYYYGNWANAQVNLYADNDLTIHGDTTARATSEGGDEGGGYANASLYVGAENDLSITGNTLAEANQTGGGGYYYYYGNWANAYANLWAGNDLTIVGDTTVRATAESQGDGAEGYARLDGWAENNLSITGDVLVTADATRHVSEDTSEEMAAQSIYSGYVSAHAEADLGAGRNVTILTDPVTVEATARQDGGSAEGNTYAYASLDVRAGDSDEGDDGEATGDLYITGDISATARASGGDYNSGVALVDLSAPGGSVTNLYGTTPPTAYAPNPDDPAHARVQAPPHLTGNFEAQDPSEGESAFIARVNIKGKADEDDPDGRVTVEPKPSAPVCARDECEVVAALKPVEPMEPLFPGRDPLRIMADGLVVWATGAGVTAPSTGAIVTADVESAIAAGADPTTLLPATAAGGQGLSAGLDAYSIGGLDYCEQVVKGACLPVVEEKGKSR